VTRLPQLLRYGAVSIISTCVGLGVLGALVATAVLSAGWANVVATAVGTVPSFELNRRWVWRKSGRRSLLGEIAPFWVLSFSGLALSTLTVVVVAGWATAHGLGTAARTVTVEGAHLAGFAALWIVQFLVLDRFLFGRRRHLLSGSAP
jgi:putative flippase GtrA